VTLNMLGRANRVVIEKENTTIVDGAGSKDEIQGRVAQIKAQIEETTSACPAAMPSGPACSSDRKHRSTCARIIANGVSAPM
jgi:hypothetical protein